jgi:uncharacterized protein (TIGR02996 family)
MNRQAFENALQQDRYDLATHLAFSDWLEENDCPEEAQFHRNWTKEWQESWDWMAWFATEVVQEDEDEDMADWVKQEKGVTVEDVLEVGREYVKTGQETCLSGMGFKATNAFYDNHRGEFYKQGNLLQDYWKHWMVLEKREVNESIQSSEPFKCCY